ncbi:MAG: hypothetical protein RBS53_07010 [Bacteroidales bacterium]|jgi:hypothetical protein|nr:hypothetical protein [Bacteroidales bacterium]
MAKKKKNKIKKQDFFCFFSKKKLKGLINFDRQIKTVFYSTAFLLIQTAPLLIISSSISIIS